jgi:hypothetical protein
MSLLMLDRRTKSLIKVHRLTFSFVLPQVFPKAEMENHLAGRLKYHAEDREAL